MQTDLITINKTPAEIFVPQGLNPLVEGVRDKVREFNELNLTAERKKDREKIKSFAMKITKTKTFVDKMRLNFVKDRKALLKIIDSEGKKFRDTLDQIRDEVRKPVTDYENAEKIRIEKERELEIFNSDHEEALIMNDIFDREKIIAEKERKFAKIEEENRKKEEAERLEKEQKEREEQIKKKAAEEAKKAAEKAAAENVANALRKEKEAREAAKKLEQERIEAAKKAEEERIEAAKKAEQDKKMAIQKAKEEFERQAKLKKEEAEKKAAEAKATEKAKAAAAKVNVANKKHQAAVNNKILTSLIKLGVSKDVAKKIITAAAKGQIEGLVVQY